MKCNLTHPGCPGDSAVCRRERRVGDYKLQQAPLKIRAYFQNCLKRILAVIGATHQICPKLLLPAFGNILCVCVCNRSYYITNHMPCQHLTWHKRKQRRLTGCKNTNTNARCKYSFFIRGNMMQLPPAINRLKPMRCRVRRWRQRFKGIPHNAHGALAAEFQPPVAC